MRKRNRFLDKKHRLTLLENVDFLSLLKLQYSGLKIILFYPEYQKTIFSDLISPKNTNKKKFDFWTKTMDYPPRKMFLFFDFLKLQFSGLKFILFYLEYQRNDLFEHNSSKTLMRKSLNFGQKPWTNPQGKLKLRFFLSKMNFFASQNIRKQSSVSRFLPKKNR